MNIQEKLSNLSNEELKEIANAVIDSNEKGALPIRPLMQAVIKKHFIEEPHIALRISNCVFKEVLRRMPIENIEFENNYSDISLVDVMVRAIVPEKPPENLIRGVSSTFEELHNEKVREYHFLKEMKRHIQLPANALPLIGENFNLEWYDGISNLYGFDKSKPNKKVYGVVKHVYRNYCPDIGRVAIEVSLIDAGFSQLDK